MRASIAETLAFDRTILMATVLTVFSEPLSPTASALTTRPKQPAPSWIPKFKNESHYSVFKRHENGK
jgi:hypothetical protein